MQRFKSYLLSIENGSFGNNNADKMNSVYPTIIIIV
jgi:hypothetical protein